MIKGRDKKMRGYRRPELDALLKALTVRDLRNACDESGYLAAGNKAQLVATLTNLLESDEVNLEQVLGASGPHELRKVCARLGLGARGRAGTLRKRLIRYGEYSQLADPIEVADSVARRLSTAEGTREHLFLLELHSWVNSHSSYGAHALPLRVIIQRIGRRRAISRARVKSVRETGEFLWSNGLTTTPNLMRLERAVPVETKITIGLRRKWAHLVEAETTRRKKKTVTTMPRNATVIEFLLRAAMAVAHSDNKLMFSELNAARQYALSRMPAEDRSGRRRLASLCDELSKKPENATYAVSSLAARLKPAEKLAAIDHLIDVALADGNFAAEEEGLISRYGYILDVPSAKLTRRLAKARQRSVSRPGKETVAERCLRDGFPSAMNMQKKQVAGRLSKPETPHAHEETAASRGKPVSQASGDRAIEGEKELRDGDKVLDELIQLLL